MFCLSFLPGVAPCDDSAYKLQCRQSGHCHSAGDLRSSSICSLYHTPFILRAHARALGIAGPPASPDEQYAVRHVQKIQINEEVCIAGAFGLWIWLKRSESRLEEAGINAAIGPLFAQPILRSSGGPDAQP